MIGTPAAAGLTAGLEAALRLDGVAHEAVDRRGGLVHEVDQLGLLELRQLVLDQLALLRAGREAVLEVVHQPAGVKHERVVPLPLGRQRLHQRLAALRLLLGHPVQRRQQRGRRPLDARRVLQRRLGPRASGWLEHDDEVDEEVAHGHDVVGRDVVLVGAGLLVDHDRFALAQQLVLH